MSEMRILYPDGRQEVRAMPPQAELLDVLQGVVGGWIEYVPVQYHALQTHEAVINDEGLINDLPPNWPGSRMIGLDLAQYPPLHGPIVVVPHDPQDGPPPAQQRARASHPYSLLNLYARALEGDAKALGCLGAARAEDVCVIDARPAPTLTLYLIYPTGRIERYAPPHPEAGRAWIAGHLGEAHCLPHSAQVVTAYSAVFSVAPCERRPNQPAHAALGVQAPWQVPGPVVLLPTGVIDPSAAHQRLDEALSGNEQACAALGLSPDWL